MGIFICDFELVDKGDRVVAFPVGLAGATEGLGLEDAVAMCADWLMEAALDFLMRGERWPSPPIGTDAARGGRMVTVAVEASLDQVPSMTASEAARTLGVSTARVAQLCKAGLLDSWKVGGTRMVSAESVETRLSDGGKPGRPRKEVMPA